MNVQRRVQVGVLGATLLLSASWSSPSAALVMCATKKGNGVRDGAAIFLRQTCRPREQVLNVSDLSPELFSITAALRSQLDADRAANQVALTELRNGLDGAKASIASQDSSINTATSKLSALETGLATANTQITNLGNSLAAVNTNLATLSSERRSYDFQDFVVGNPGAPAPGPGGTRTLTQTWIFVGQTTPYINVSTKKVIGSAVAVLGWDTKASTAGCGGGATCYIGVDLCYQVQGQTAVVPFSGANPAHWLTVSLTGPYVPVPITEFYDFKRYPIASSGPVRIGYCVRSTTVSTTLDGTSTPVDVNLDKNDAVIGVITLVNSDG